MALKLKKVLPPFDHQTKTTEFILNRDATFITSDPGTGKTRSVIDAYAQRKTGKMLVFAPLSILQSSWGDDIEKFQPDLTYSIAYAKNREEAATADVDVVIVNHDAVKWFDKHPQHLKGFDTLVVDESTAFKNRTSQRSKAMARISKFFKYRIAMTGTPNPNTVLDTWHQLFILDEGERLGRRFFSFRQAVCTSRFNGFANEWHDKENAQETVASLIFDINIRFELEECIDMPEHIVSDIMIDLPPKAMKAYKQLLYDSAAELETGAVTAVHAGARATKLLQLCTGAVYNEDGEIIKCHKQRYDLVMDLVEQRAHSVVAFNWRHEREALVEEAEKRGIYFGVIDGTTPAADRTKIVESFQNGELQVIFAHPQSAGHGLTLTRGTTTIWCSPTYNAEHYTQFNRRIYRAGQTKRTETIRIAARDTWEVDVYEKLGGKVFKMSDLLATLKQLTGG
jgi:SNF2 family DNA or RNA helicase